MSVLFLHTLSFYAKGSSHSNKTVSLWGRVEASLCPPAVPSNDHPHGNAGLISSHCGYIPSPSAQSPRHRSSKLWWATRGRTERGEGEVNKTKERGGCYNTRHTCISVFRPSYSADISDIFKPYWLHTVVVKPTTCWLYYYTHKWISVPWHSFLLTTLSALWRFCKRKKYIISKVWGELGIYSSLSPDVDHTDT